MKQAIIFFTAFLLLAGCLAQELDYEDEPVVKPAPIRPSVLRRGSIAPRPRPGAATTTTPAPKEVVEEEPIEEEEGYEEEVAEEEQTTTEAGRRLKSIRPFRSNDDLIAALKRRRAQAANGKHHHNEATSAPVVLAKQESEPKESPKSQAGGRRRFNLGKADSSPPAEQPAPAAAKPSARNRFSARGLYKTGSNDNAEISGLESSQQSVEVKPRTPFKPGQRRF